MALNLPNPFGSTSVLDSTPEKSAVLRTPTQTVDASGPLKWNIEKVVVPPRLRELHEETVCSLVTSVRQCQLIDPISVRLGDDYAVSGHLILVAGLHRLEAARRLGWTRGLLIRRHIADGDLAFFTTWCPAGTSIETLVAVEGHRWAIEDSFETAKNEFGLDHNESRSWHGWHRHVSLVMLAFAMMAVIRHRANPPPPKKTQRRTTAKTKASPRRH
ncbi:MAG: transposase of family [Tardiphaga sp.]|nr:transposase of family [Tardiphaga sp.]